MGPGWAHGFEQSITEGERAISLREAEGRSVHFAKIKPGESTFHRRERMTLSRDRDGSYRVFKLDGRLTCAFSASRAGGPALLRSMSDAWENAIELEHEGERLTRIVDTAGREVRVLWKESRIARLEVRADGQLAQWVDYTYSAAGCLETVADALGHTDEYEYDRWNRMIAATIKTGARFQYEYQENTGKCQKTWGPKGLYAIELRIDPAAKTTYVEGEEPRIISWNEQGEATRIALPDGTVIEETAYDDDGFLVARVNGAGEGTQYWYDARGNRIRTVDASGNVTAIEYDERDLPTKRTTADGLVTELAHDDKGALAGMRFPTGELYSLSYDQRGHLTTVSSGGQVRKGLEYDASHDVIAEIDARGARTAYSYDALGRPVTREDPLGRVTRVAYDRLGRRIMARFPDGTTISRGYDALGNLTREIDTLGRVTSMEYAGMGVLAKLIEPDGRVWSFKHTSEERLAEIKNPRNETHTFTYDEAGQVASEKGFDGRVLRYRYNPGGTLERI
ncbi:MAG: hypothetical protein ABI134_13150, partial [Byssovorax sp.]